MAAHYAAEEGSGLKKENSIVGLNVKACLKSV